MKEEILQKLESFKISASQRFEQAPDEQALYEAKVAFLGKKGGITEILKDLGKLSVEDRPLIGQKANAVKAELETHYQNRQKFLVHAKLDQELSKSRIDTTLPGRPQLKGHHHPISLMLDKLTDIFSRMGFDIFEGPEIETDYYNFEALNIPKNHPARDMQDTFYIDETRLLRTHTSPVQVHVMEQGDLPIYMIAPGTVYRKDSDVTHTPMFHQIEGLVVDQGINLTHLKGVVENLLKQIFDSNTKVRFRPSFFPFTEPSAEVDIGCVICASKGCRVCKGTGWLEVMGCGMVHPNVFKASKIDSKKYTGFAFGMGVERLTMLYYGVNDLRLFFENDLRFLNQF